MERMDVLRKPGADAAGHPAGRRAALLPALAIVAVAVSCGAAPSFAAGATPYRRGVVLLAFKPGVSAARQRAIERGAGGTQAHALGPAIRPVAGHRQPPQPLLLRLGMGTVAGAVAWLRGRR